MKSSHVWWLLSKRWVRFFSICKIGVSSMDDVSSRTLKRVRWREPRTFPRPQRSCSGLNRKIETRRSHHILVLYHSCLSSRGSWEQVLDYYGQFNEDVCRMRAFDVVLEELEVAENCRFSSSDGMLHRPVVDVKLSFPGSWWPRNLELQYLFLDPEGIWVSQVSCCGGFRRLPCDGPI